MTGTRAERALAINLLILASRSHSLFSIPLASGVPEQRYALAPSLQAAHSTESRRCRWESGGPQTQSPPAADSLGTNLHPRGQAPNDLTSCNNSTNPGAEPFELDHLLSTAVAFSSTTDWGFSASTMKTESGHNPLRFV